MSTVFDIDGAIANPKAARDGNRMRWMKITILTILTLLAISANADMLSQDSTHTGNRLTTADAAIARALAYTGFDQSPSFSRETTKASASLITFRDSVVPYEYDWEAGRAAWSITFEGVILNFPNEELRSQEYARDFDVIIDAETGQLLKVISPVRPEKWGVDTDPWARQTESWGRLNPNVHLGSLDSLIPVDLFGILSKNRAIRFRGTGTSPSVAKGMIIYYVVYTSDAPLLLRDKNPRAVWLVMLKDFKEGATPEKEKSVYPMRGYYYYDAESGEAVGLSTGEGLYPESVGPPPGPQ